MSANDTELIERIGAELAQSDAVIVVGSDFSRHSGLPDHEETLSQLASFVNESTSSNSSSAAIASADFLNSGGPSSTEHLAQFMRQACRVGTAQPHAVFRKLVELLPSCFIATTHDCLLDASLRIWRGQESFESYRIAIRWKPRNLRLLGHNILCSNLWATLTMSTELS
jgi:hypothetical protein